MGFADFEELMGSPSGTGKYNDFQELMGNNNHPVNEETKDNGFLGWAKDAFDVGVAGTLKGQADFTDVNFGVGKDTSNYLGDVVKRNSRTRDVKPELTNINYYTDPQGALYDLSNAAGSMTAMGLETAIAILGAKAVGAGALGAGAAGLATKIPAGAKLVNGIKTAWSTPVGKLAIGNVAMSVPESISQGGSIVDKMRAEGKSEDEIQAAVNKDTAMNAVFLAGTKGLESAGLLGAGKMGVGLAKRILGGAAAGGTINAAEEGGQSMIDNIAQGENINYDDAADSAKVGLLVGGVLGGVGGGMTSNEYLTGNDNQDTTSQPTNLNDAQSQAWGEAQWVSEQTGVPAEFVYRQWAHESGNFTSQLAKENNNFGGLTQVESNGEENKQPDGGNYYKQYNNMHEYAQDYIKSFLRHYDGVGNVKSIEEFAHVLKDNGYYGDSVENYINGLKGIEAPSGNGTRKDYANNSSSVEINSDLGGAEFAQQEKELLNQLVNEKIEIAVQKQDVDEWSFLTENENNKDAILERYPDIAEKIATKKQSPAGATTEELHHSDLLDAMNIRDYNALGGALQSGDVITQAVDGKYDFVAKTPAGEAIVKKMDTAHKKAQRDQKKIKTNIDAFNQYVGLAEKNNIRFDTELMKLGQAGNRVALNRASSIFKSKGINVRKALMDHVIATAKPINEKRQEIGDMVNSAKDDDTELIDKAITYHDQTNDPVEKSLLEHMVNSNNMQGLKDVISLIEKNEVKLPKFTPPKASRVFVPGKQAAVSGFTNLVNNLKEQKGQRLANEIADVREQMPLQRQSLTNVLGKIKEQKGQPLANEIADAREQIPVQRQALTNVLSKIKKDKQTENTENGLSKLDINSLIRVADNVADMPMTNKIKQIVGKELAKRGVLPPAVTEGVNFDRDMLNIAKDNLIKQKKPKKVERVDWGYPLEKPVQPVQYQNTFMPEEFYQDSEKFREKNKVREKFLNTLENITVQKFDAAESTMTYERQLLDTAKEKNLKLKYDKLEADIAKGNPKATSVLETLLKQNGVNVGQIKFSFNDRHNRDRERMRAMEKAAQEFVPENYKGIASGVMEGLAEHEIKSIKNYLQSRIDKGESLEYIEKELKMIYNEIKANKSEGRTEKQRINAMRFLKGAIAHAGESIHGGRIYSGHGERGQRYNERGIASSNEQSNFGRSQRTGITANDGIARDNQINQDKHPNEGAFSMPGKTYEQRLIDAAKENGIKADYAKLQRHIEQGIPRAATFLEEELTKKGINPKQLKFSYKKQEVALREADNKQPSLTDKEVVQMVKASTGQTIYMIPKEAKIAPKLQRIVDFGKMMGCPVRYYDGVSSLRGFHTDGVTYINRRSELPHSWVFWHESFHWLKNNNEKLYQEMVKYLQGTNAFSKEKINAYREELGRTELSDMEVMEEMLADAMPEVSKRVGLMKQLAKNNSSLAERFVAWINDTMDRFHEFFTTPEHGLSPRDKRSMVEAFTNLARDMVDGSGKKIFLLEPGRKLTLARNSQPVSTALELVPAHTKDVQKPWQEGVSKETLSKIVGARNELNDYLTRHGETINIDTSERHALRNKIANKLYGTGAKNKNSEIYIVLGPPAAGKSSVAEPLAERTGSLIIDSDMAKELLPEFKNGRLAGAVHKESDYITSVMVMEKVLENGDNIVLPVVGKTYNGIVERINVFKDHGYKVNIVHVDLPIDKAVQRAIARFEETGRFVNPDYVASVGYSTRENYDKIKNIEGIDNYEAFSNDVARGERPALLERGMAERGMASTLYKGSVNASKKAQGRSQQEQTEELNHSDKQGGFSMPENKPKYSYKSNAEHQSFIKRLTHPFTTSKGQELNRKAAKEALEDLLDMKVRSGHIDKDLLSIIDETSGIIRSRHSYDWDNILPHVGTVVAKRLKLNNTDKAAENYIARWLMDGALSEESSQVAQDFKKAMQGDIEFADKLTEIRNMFDEMSKRTADMQIQSTISTDKETPAIMDSIKDYLQRHYDEYIEEFGPIERMVKQVEKKIGKPLSFGANPFLAFRMWRGRFGKAITLIEGNHLGAIKALQTHFPGVNFDNFKTINMILKNIGANKDKSLLNKFGTYCLAKHARDIHAHNEKGEEFIVTPPEWSLENCEYTIKKYEKENPAFVQAQKDIVNFSNVTMQIMRDAGLLNNEQYHERVNKWKNYVPLFREFEDNENISFGDSTKRLHGSTKNIINPIESIIHNTYKFVDMAAKNKAKNTLRMLCQINDTGEFLNEVESNNPNDKTCFSVMVDGKKKWFQTDPAIVAAINNMRPEQVSLFWKMISYPVKLLRAGSTFMSPEFVLRNPFRDYVDALLYSKHGFIKPTDLLHGFISAIKADDLYWEFQVNGGAQAAAVAVDRNYSQFTIDKMMQKNNKADILKPWKWLEYIQAVSEFSEYATRLAYFKKTQDGLTKINPAINKSLCLQEAAFESRDLMDFARGGKSSRKWNQWAIFANASLQGWDKTFRTFNAKDPKNRKQAIAAMARIGMYTLLPTLAFWFWNRDDDRYKNLPHWVKDTHYTFSVGDKTYRVPKGQDAMNIILSGELERFLNYAYTKDPKALDKKLEPIKQLLPGLMPTMVMPIIEAMSNYSFFKEGSIVPQYQQKLTPKMQYGPYTTSIGKWLGEKLDIAPRKIDHALFGYTGSLGRLATGAYDTASGDKQLNLSLEELPFVRGLMLSPYKNSKYVDEYYDERIKQESLYNEMKATGKRPEEFDPRLYARLKSIAQPMQHLSKMERTLMNNEKMPIEVKKQKQDEIQKRRIEIVKRAMGVK